MFHTSPWPECKGARDYPHAGRPMTPLRPLTKPRPGVPAPETPQTLRNRITQPTGLTYRRVHPPKHVPVAEFLSDAA